MTEIYIEGQPVDVSQGFSNLFEFAVDDISNLGTRRTGCSKTIILPGTARNNKLFGHIFRPEAFIDYVAGAPNVLNNFNPAVSAKCVVFESGIQSFSGVMQLFETIEVDNSVEYEVGIFGNLSGFGAGLGLKTLEDLLWGTYSSYYNTSYDLGAILDSWDHATTLKKVRYPLIDYGQGLDPAKHNWEITNFKPALPARDYVDYIFQEAGYRYDCALFDTDRFKGLTIPYNKKTLTKNTARILDISDPADDLVASNPTLFFNYAIPMGSGDFGQFVITSTGVKWTGPNVAAQVFIVTRMEFRTSPGGGVQVYLKQNGSVLADLGYYPYPATTFTQDIGPIATALFTGDTIDLVAFFDGAADPSDYLLRKEIQLLVLSPYPLLTPVNLTETFGIRDIVPKGVLQRDFVSSILNLFNLYITEDRFDDRLLHISPYPDFYSEASTNALDWTYKVDRSKAKRLKPMSEMTSRYLEFKFKDDSDFYNDLYKKRYNEGYGARLVDTGYMFAGDKTTVELIFAPTPLVGYLGEDKVYSTILKQTGTGASIKEEPTDSVIRILQCKKITGVDPWHITDGGGSTVDYTEYLYAGHFDNPDVPANDLNFGIPKELFFGLASGTLEVNQYNVYWSPRVAEISDPNSKLLTCTIYLTQMDIANLDFSKYVHIDGSLYRLQRIVDYNMTEPSTCRVELLKVVNTIY